VHSTKKVICATDLCNHGSEYATELIRPPPRNIPPTTNQSVSVYSSRQHFIADDWLKVWGSVRGYGEKWRLQRDRICKQSVYYKNSNEPLEVATLTALAGAGPGLGRPTFSMDWRLLLQNVEERWRVFLLRYMYNITLQNILFSNRANTVISRLTKIIRSGITFVSRNLR